jgi:hypothetical protein
LRLINAEGPVTGEDHMIETHELRAGIDFVRAELATLSQQYEMPLSPEFRFEETDQDFDNCRLSLFAPGRNQPICQFQTDDLEDCATTPGVREKLRAILRRRIRTIYPQKPALG